MLACNILNGHSDPGLAAILFEVSDETEMRDVVANPDLFFLGFDDEGTCRDFLIKTGAEPIDPISFMRKQKPEDDKPDYSPSFPRPRRRKEHMGEGRFAVTGKPVIREVRDGRLRVINRNKKNKEDGAARAKWARDKALRHKPLVLEDDYERDTEVSEPRNGKHLPRTINVKPLGDHLHLRRDWEIVGVCAVSPKPPVLFPVEPMQPSRFPYIRRGR